MTDDLTTLDGLQSAAWSRMTAAVKDRRGPAHLMTFATTGQGGADARLLVLRAADPDAGQITFWTNGASAKIADLAADPRASALFWDAGALLQVRLRLTVRIGPGPAAVWDALPDHARANYRPGPGRALADPTAAADPPEQALFTALTCQVDQMECLHFGADRHRRAHFTSSQSRWIAP